MSKRVLLVICLLAVDVVSPLAHAGAGLSAKWVPAMRDSASCAPLPRRYYATCRPRGRVELSGRNLLVSADLSNCEFSREAVGSPTPAAWLIVDATVLRPRAAACFCPSVGCCQPLPERQTVAFPVSSADGKVRFRTRLPFPTNSQVEISSIEIRAAGDCLQTEVIDLQSGEPKSFQAGPALAVSGTGRIPPLPSEGFQGQ